MSSCVHFPFGELNKDLDIAVNIRPFTFLTAPLVRGWLTDAKVSLILSSLSKFLKSVQSNCFPLSTVMYADTLNRQIILCQTKLIRVPDVIFASAFASIHLVKYSSATTMNRRLPGVDRSGPTILTLHLYNSHVGMIDLAGLQACSASLQTSGIFCMCGPIA